MKINSNCKLLVEVYSIWIQKSSQSYDFGIYLRPILIKFVKDYIYNYRLMDNSDSDIDDVPDTEINPVKESPVKENPVKENPVKENPVKESPVKESPVKENPVKESPVKESPAKESPAQKEEFDSIFMKLKQENLEMPPLETIYQTDVKEKSFMSVLTELNPELLSKNYSETSEENVFIKDTMTIKVVSSDESSEIEHTSET
jgi:hypothetical protein